MTQIETVVLALYALLMVLPTMTLARTRDIRERHYFAADKLGSLFGNVHAQLEEFARLGLLEYNDMDAEHPLRPVLIDTLATALALHQWLDQFDPYWNCRDPDKLREAVRHLDEAREGGEGLDALFTFLVDSVSDLPMAVKIGRALNSLDWRLCPKFETPWQIILLERIDGSQQSVSMLWRDTASFPPWTTQTNHPLSTLTMQMVVWVDSAVGAVSRIPVRELIERLADLGCSGATLSWVIPAIVDDLGHDSNLCSEAWGLLALDAVQISVNDEAINELARKINTIAERADFDLDNPDQSLITYPETMLLSNTIQIRLADADLLQ